MKTYEDYQAEAKKAARKILEAAGATEINASAPGSFGVSVYGQIGQVKVRMSNHSVGVARAALEGATTIYMRLTATAEEVIAAAAERQAIIVAAQAKWEAAAPARKAAAKKAAQKKHAKDLRKAVANTRNRLARAAATLEDVTRVVEGHARCLRLLKVEVAR